MGGYEFQTGRPYDDMLIEDDGEAGCWKPGGVQGVRHRAKLYKYAVKKED